MYLKLDEPLHGSQALAGDTSDAVIAEIENLQRSQALETHVLEAGQQIVAEIEEEQVRHVDESISGDFVDTVLLELGALQHR